ncbi:MAG: septum formation initiator family protein [Jatrophihabitantaceae bacterium]
MAARTRTRVAGEARPAGGAFSAGRGGSRPAWMHAPKLTGRRMMVAAMALFLVVVLASPFQTYLSRRASVADSERQQRQLSAQLAQLRHQSEQWQDPAFVARQARIRLQYIRPGDTLYTVLDAHGNPLGPPAASATAEKVTRIDHRPSWNSVLWTSVHDVDTSQ